jgi:hypothetical protein
LPVDHALREYLELDVAYYRVVVPGQWRCPQGGNVGDAARDGRQMGVSRWEEMQTDVGREDIVRERRLKEGWEALLEDSQCCIVRRSVS